MVLGIIAGGQEIKRVREGVTILLSDVAQCGNRFRMC